MPTNQSSGCLPCRGTRARLDSETRQTLQVPSQQLRLLRVVLSGVRPDTTSTTSRLMHYQDHISSREMSLDDPGVG